MNYMSLAGTGQLLGCGVIHATGVYGKSVGSQLVWIGQKIRLC